MAVTRITLFAAALVLAFTGAFAVGGVVDPDVGSGEDKGHGAADADHARAGQPARIVVEDRELDPGEEGTLAFAVVDSSGQTIRDFDVEHEREMHLVVARHDLTGYQHLHPRQRADGSWEAPVVLGQAGPHRLYADFSSGGESHTLTADVRGAGDYRPSPLPAPARTAGAGGGYMVEIAGSGSERRFKVLRHGHPVDDVEPYLGARGHLVALREGSLEFLHAHPKDAATEGREIGFGVSYAASGRYRLFLQFRHDGEVRTAAFTETVAADGHDGGRPHGH